MPRIGRVEGRGWRIAVRLLEEVSLKSRSNIVFQVFVEKRQRGQEAIFAELDSQSLEAKR